MTKAAPKYRLWITESTVLGKVTAIHWDGTRTTVYANYGWHDISDSRFVLQEFTGYQDKNGTDIYEGDIVNDLADNDVFLVEYDEFADCCVEGETWTLTFYPEHEDGFHPYNPTVYYHRGELEVIGNLCQGIKTKEQSGL